MADKPDPRDWHGHRIVTEDDLVQNFTDDDPEHVDDPRRYMRRLRHGMVLALLAAMLVAALVAAYLVMTKQLVIPGWEPGPPAAASATAAHVCPQETYDYAAPKEVTVNVLNGTKVSGLAGATAKKLKKRGFRIGTVGNADLSDPDIVAAVVAGASGQSKALTVQRNIRGTEFIRDPKRSADTVDLIIGKKFKDLLAEKKVKTTPGKLSCPIAVKAAQKAADEAAKESAKNASTEPAKGPAK